MTWYSTPYRHALTVRYRDWLAEAIRLRRPYLLDPVSRASYLVVMYLARTYRPNQVPLVDPLLGSHLSHRSRMDHAAFLFIMQEMPPAVLNDFCLQINCLRIEDHRMGEGEEGSLPFPGYPLMERMAFVVGCHIK